MQAESSKLSVNERLARAREEDLRRCRNLQAKLARAQAHEDDLEPATGPTTARLTTPATATASSSSRVGLMYLSSTEQAQRERDQMSRERQLKRQVAGPIPPESWREEFDRLTIRRSVDPHASSQRHLSHALKGDSDRRQTRSQHRAVCAGLRQLYDSPQPGRSLSLLDTTLCVIADVLNRPGQGGRDQAFQAREVLEYLPEHIQQRMLSLCGRFAATDWSLGEWTAQALVDLNKAQPQDSGEDSIDADLEDGGDWETNLNPAGSNKTLAYLSEASLDLSFSTISSRTFSRMLTMSNGQLGVSLRMLSLAGCNGPYTSSTTPPLDSPSMQSIFAQLSNLQILSLAGSRLSRAVSGEEGGPDHQRAAVFLRKLSRSLTKLRTLDLSYCRWVSADALLGVSWATPATIAWPRLESLLLVACEAVADPRDRAPDVDPAAFAGKAAGNHVAPWHATHSQRAVADSANRATDQTAVTGTLYDAYTDTVHRDPFDLFPAPTPPQRPTARATFSDYVNNAIQPAIISHMTPVSSASEPVLMEHVRCPRSAGKVEMWQWQRARILEAVRGRSQPGSRQRNWIEVYF